MSRQSVFRPQSASFFPPHFSRFFFVCFFFFRLFCTQLGRAVLGNKNQKCCLTRADVSYQSDRVVLGGEGRGRSTFRVRAYGCHGDAHALIPWRRRSRPVSDGERESWRRTSRSSHHQCHDFFFKDSFILKQETLKLPETAHLFTQAPQSTTASKQLTASAFQEAGEPGLSLLLAPPSLLTS